THGIIYGDREWLAKHCGISDRWFRAFVSDLIEAGWLKEGQQRNKGLPSIIWFPRLIDLEVEQTVFLYWSLARTEQSVRYVSAGRSAEHSETNRQSDRQRIRQPGAGHNEPPPTIENESGGDGDGGSKETAQKLLADIFSIVGWTRSRPLPRELVQAETWLRRARIASDNPLELILDIVRSLELPPCGVKSLNYFADLIPREI